MPEQVVASGTLPVMEHFYTIQGEGCNTGKASYFIRLGGCDVGCVWCDVKDSWDVNKHPLLAISELVKQAKQYPSRLAVITGGEPLMHDLNELTRILHEDNFETCIETSGAYPLSGKWNWICVSPKKFKSPLKEVLHQADELKVIIYNKSDFDWAVQHATQVQEKCKLLLQPEYGKFDDVIPLIVDYVKNNPKWQISLQTHKIIHVP